MPRTSKYHDSIFTKLMPGYTKFWYVKLYDTLKEKRSKPGDLPKLLERPASFWVDDKFDILSSKLGLPEHPTWGDWAKLLRDNECPRPEAVTGQTIPYLYGDGTSNYYMKQMESLLAWANEMEAVTFPVLPRVSREKAVMFWKEICVWKSDAERIRARGDDILENVIGSFKGLTNALVCSGSDRLGAIKEYFAGYKQFSSRVLNDLWGAVHGTETYYMDLFDESQRVDNVKTLQLWLKEHKQAVHICTELLDILGTPLEEKGAAARFRELAPLLASGGMVEDDNVKALAQAVLEGRL